MKRLFSLLFCWVMATLLMAQAPQKFTYQAVVRDAAGNLVSNAPVGVRVSILESAADGDAVYCETHLNNTNATGLLTLEVGGGTATDGDFASIDWPNGPYFLKTEMDVKGGTNYTITSSQQLLSVPYALYAHYAGNSIDLEERISNLEKRLDSLKQGGRSSFNFLKVETSEVTSITSNSAKCGGEVIWESDDNAHVSSRGVCWSTSPNPTKADNMTIDGNGLGRFTSSITGLTDNTTYYVRAYATNSIGTVYGEQKSFTTASDLAFACGISTVSDYDKNAYNTVQIGEQCWIAENLRTTSYADGTSILQGSGTSNDVAYWYYPQNDSSNKVTYGLLYNWLAVMRNPSSSSANPSGVQGICPNGWHVPSDAEWDQLVDYVSSQSEYRCGNDEDYIAKALASTTGWDSSPYTCDVGNDPSSNNATGYSAVPAGCYSGGYGDYFDYYAYFWSTTKYNSYVAYYRYIYSYHAYVGRGNISKHYGYSVRCLRN